MTSVNRTRGTWKEWIDEPEARVINALPANHIYGKWIIFSIVKYKFYVLQKVQCIFRKLCPVRYIKNVKLSRYRPGVAHRVGRGIALLFHDRGTRRGWVVSSTPRPHFTPGKEPVPILQEAGWAPGLVWTGGKSRPHRDSIPERPPRS